MASTTTISSSKNPSLLNQSITFTATVTEGSCTPTGTVTFKDGNTILGTRNLNGAGQTALSTLTLSAGNHGITATYNGNATYFPVTSSVLIQVVN